MSLFLGVDFGTSGVRTDVIDETGARVASCSVPMPVPTSRNGRPSQDPKIWWNAFGACVDRLSVELGAVKRHVSEITALSVDGTSGTLLLADSGLRPVTPALMYNSGGFDVESEAIARYAPPDSIVRSASSALARLIFLQKLPDARNAAFAMHQADWVAARLAGTGGFSDENNVLKLGYDLVANSWPRDLYDRLAVRVELLPEVLPVGHPTGTVCSTMGARFGFGSGTRIVSGTTDSIASFVASGATRVGEGVTSLGTTIVLKLLSDSPVSDARHGVYSHRVFGKWLAGGASNAGGGVLLDHFSLEQMALLGTGMDTDSETGLDYYPLSAPGERFPVSDPSLQPRLTPRPLSDASFLQGMLEGLTRIERTGYEVLRELGAPEVRTIRTTGGGAKNEAWLRIRRRMIACPISVAPADAATGSAMIALRSASEAISRSTGRANLPGGTTVRPRSTA